MELEKTTVLSALVWVAGVLSEVVFHEALSNSVLGLVLSIIVAVIVIAATYFIIDGVNSVLIKQRKETEDRQHEYQERMFRMLNDKLEEQVNIESSLYESIGEMIAVSRDCADRITGMPIGVEGEMHVSEIVETINANTLQAAKIIAKYQIKNSESINELLDEIKSEVIKIGELDGSSVESNNSELLETSKELIETLKELLDNSNEILTNNKELLETSKELLGNSNGLLETNGELLDSNNGQLDNSKEILAANKELTERLSRIEDIIKNIEPAKVEEIKAYIDSVIEGVNTQMMKKAFTAQRTAVNSAAARTAAKSGTTDSNKAGAKARTQVRPDTVESGIARIAKVSGSTG